MGKPFKIIISKNSILSVYSDKMNLHKLGTPTVHRATEVKFNNKSCTWEIIVLPPFFKKEKLIASGFDNRKEAIDWEISFLNANLEAIADGPIEI